MLGETTLSTRLQSTLFAIPFGYIAYLSYRSLYPKRKKKRAIKKRRISTKIKRASSKKISSKRMRIIRATTIPMRMFKARSGGMKLKAEDWVAEQRKLKSLT